MNICSDCEQPQTHPLTVTGPAALCDHCIRCEAGADCADERCPHRHGQTSA